MRSGSWDPAGLWRTRSNRVHSERRHLSRRLRQPQPAGDHARRLADPQVGGISADLSGGQRLGGVLWASSVNCVDPVTSAR